MLDHPRATIVLTLLATLVLTVNLSSLAMSWRNMLRSNAAELERTHSHGVATGYALCLADREGQP